MIEINLDRVTQAVRDYRYLLDRGYNSTGALRLVEERYLLSKLERDLLLRGVHSRLHDERVRSNAEEGARRLKKGGVTIALDFFNALITISEALEGGVLSIGSDGFLRDHAKVLGRSRKTAETLLSSCRLLSALPISAALRLVGDKDYPHSATVLLACSEWLKEKGFKDVKVILTGSVDSTLLGMAKDEGSVVASSDMVVLERADAIIDVPMLVLKEVFGELRKTRAVIVDLYSLLYSFTTMT